MSELHFFIDDSGTRSPDRAGAAATEPGRGDWFALGGVLVDAEEEPIARALHANFCSRWGITYPLHSSDIRFRKGHFDWLARLGTPDFERFHSELSQMLIDAPVLGIACVIDRPGYNHRYLAKYGRNRWSLCKTAFSVIVERAAKVALERGRRLRVMPERADKKADRWLKGYYESLRLEGMPFASDTSSKYGPLSQDELRRTLLEFRPKQKSSPMVQIADLYLYPMCRAGYGPYRPYEILVENGKLIDCHLSDDARLLTGIKYSCFDLVQEKMAI